MVVKLNLQTYAKLLMHSLKYPYAKVNGVLLSKKQSNESDDKDQIEFVDYIPLFHFNQGLTPMLEIALIQLEAYCSKHNLQIAGYFQANKNFHDSSIDIFAQKIAEKLLDFNPSTVIVVLNSYNLAEFLTKDVPFDSTLNLLEQQDGKWKSSNTIKINRADTEIRSAIRNFIFEDQLHLTIDDFDCHLHDVKCDWLNRTLNDRINEWLNN